MGTSSGPEEVFPLALDHPSFFAGTGGRGNERISSDALDLRDFLTRLLSL